MQKTEPVVTHKSVSNTGSKCRHHFGDQIDFNLTQTQNKTKITEMQKHNT